MERQINIIYSINKKKPFNLFESSHILLESSLIQLKSAQIELESSRIYVYK